MFVISIVSAAVRSGKSFPFSAPAAPICTGSASAAGPACRVRECFSGFRPTASAPQGISCAPAEHGAKLRYRAEQTKRKRKVPDPESGSQPTKPPVSGPPAATARKNRTIPQTVPLFGPRSSSRGSTAYAAIRQPMPRAYSGHQRSRRAVSSAPQCSKYLSLIHISEPTRPY